MALVYFDASALVKLLVDESGSAIAAELWNGCDAALSSRLTYAEVVAALAASGRNHDLTESEVDTALADCEIFWAAIRPVELTAKIADEAGVLSRRYSLSGADAIHLASAQALATPELIVSTWDRRLHAGAAASGIAVAPAELS